MVQTPTEYLDSVAAFFVSAFAPVVVATRDDRPERSLLEMWGQFGSYRVRLLEVVTSGGPRKYAYYVLKDQRVIAAFDNAPDPHALRLKYGNAYTAHRHEPVPHRHTADKAQIELTSEMTCADFVAWVQANLSSES